MSEEKAKRTKKSANFTLEQFGETSAEGLKIWFEVKEGFISPKKAFEYAEENKVPGVLRVVRVASDLFEGTLTQAEPIYVMKNLNREPRKPRKPRTLKVNPVETTAPETNPAQEPVTDEGEALPPDGDQDGI